MIRGVKFVTIPTSDQDAALEFYTTMLGFRVVTDQPFDETQRWIELAVGKGATKVVLFTMPGHQDRIGTTSNMTFVADDVDRTYEELSARGVEFVQPPAKADWGTAAIFRDPDGNQFVPSSK